MMGWRWIGIIASVIWFFGFGVLLWNQYVEDAVAPYAQDLKICSAIEEYSDQFWQENARDRVPAISVPRHPGFGVLPMKP